MAFVSDREVTGQIESPGGFVFGIQGWNWGEPRPRSITFFLDGTAKVCDQWGRPIRGSIDANNKQILFAMTAPEAEQDGRVLPRKGLATHADVIKALLEDRVEWKSLTCAGWPQLPYDELKKLDPLPPTPIEELAKIRDPNLRKDAMRIRREVDEKLAQELGLEKQEDE